MITLNLSADEFAAFRAAIQRHMDDALHWERACIDPPVRQHGLDRARARIAEVQAILDILDKA